MAEIINLKLARKRKAREEASLTADENRIKFGRTKAGKRLTESEKKREKALLDGHEKDR